MGRIFIPWAPKGSNKNHASIAVPEGMDVAGITLMIMAIIDINSF